VFHIASEVETTTNDRSPETLPLIGGALCLDFCNTISWRTSPEPVDRLGDHDGLVRWSVHAGALPAAPLEPRDRGEAAAAFDRAARLRAHLVASFEAIAAGREPGVGDLDACRIAFVDAVAAASLPRPGADLEWPDGADRPLWPIAVSAWSLLTAPRRPRVRMCAGTGCGWLFIDDSRNASRRWCSGDDCGRRERVRRHRARRAARREALG
jgi:predicted RNA-binding Zn ribbon-like protein